MSPVISYFHDWAYQKKLEQAEGSFDDYDTLISTLNKAEEYANDKGIEDKLKAKINRVYKNAYEYRFQKALDNLDHLVGNGLSSEIDNLANLRFKTGEEISLEIIRENIGSELYGSYLSNLATSINGDGIAEKQTEVLRYLAYKGNVKSLNDDLISLNNP